jgi:hypothetical protein
MVKLNDFRMNRSATPVWHNQAAEAEHHAGTALTLPDISNPGDVTVHSCIPVFPRVNDSRTERIAHFRINAGQRVV